MSLRRVALLVAVMLAVVLTVAGLGRSLAVDGRLPAPVPNAMAQANVLLQQGRWAEAAAHYETVVSISPGERPAWFYLGVAIASLGDQERLTRAYRAARRNEREMAEALEQGVRAAAHWRSLTEAERARVQAGR